MAKSDQVLFYSTIVLVAFGFLALFSASLGLAPKNPQATFSVVFRQLIFGLGAGVALFFITLNIPYKFWKKVALPFFLLTIVLMLFVVFSPWGASFGGAKRWLVFGPLSFQPAEALKFGFLIYLASWLNSRRRDLQSVKMGLLPFLSIMGLIGVLLMIQPDLSTLIVITLSAGFLFFLAGGPIRHLGILLILAIIIFLVLSLIEPYRFSRIMVFLNPEYDPQGIGYQINQSLIAVGSGGLFGRGFGMSLQKFNYLPESTSDSIFAIVAEEFGLVGAAFLILMFLVFLWRGLKISSRSPDLFGRLLGAGIVIVIVVQAFLNIGAMIGLVPIVGIPLPFISQGGTALAFNLAQVGVLLNISKYGKV